MRKILDGFFWGIGFAVAVVLVLATYFIVGHIKIEQTYKYSMRELVKEDMDTFVDSLSLELVNSQVVDNEILLTTKMINLGLTPNAFGLSLRFSLFNTDGEFMGQCEAKIPFVSSEEESIHMLTSCKTKLYPADTFHKATVDVLRQ